MVECYFLLVPVLVKVSIRAERAVAIPVVPTTSARGVRRNVYVFATRLLYPEDTVRRARRVRNAKDSVGKVAPCRALRTVSPSYSIDHRSLHPGEVVVNGLKDRTGTPLAGLDRSVRRQGETVRRDCQGRKAVDRHVTTCPPRVVARALR